MPQRGLRKVAIVDFQLGNLFSVQQACAYAGLQPVITHDGRDIISADGVILPGVGAFGDAMANLHRSDLIGPIQESIHKGKPFFAICLGMQLLMSRSEEFGAHDGLGIIEGSVVRFPPVTASGEKIKVPQVGWNQIFFGPQEPHGRPANPFCRAIAQGEYMYFVHSFYAQSVSEKVIMTKTVYEGVSYCSSLVWKNVFAVQFHPERSARWGLQFYKNWAEIIQSIHGEQDVFTGVK